MGPFSDPSANRVLARLLFSMDKHIVQGPPILLMLIIVAEMKIRLCMCI